MLTVKYKSLLVCGVFASLLYVGTDILAAVRYEARSSFRWAS
jgi:hypothetical protein